MRFKLGLVCLAGISIASGCSATAEGDGVVDPFAREEAAASRAELTTSTARLVGAYKDERGAIRPPTFEGLVLKADGSFFAEVDTGIRCVTTPCPSHERLAGTFRATKTLVRLESATDSTEESGFYGVYRYTLDQGKLGLRRVGAAWDGWENTLSKEESYCGAPADCERQDLVHVDCVGAWTCDVQRACAFSCGVVKTEGPSASVVWPADRTKLVAESPGGGFTPPPAGGSTCRFGAAKYTFDVASKNLSWTKCGFIDWDTPMHPYSGERTLGAGELAMIDRAMGEVAITHRDLCGADKPYLTIQVSSASHGTLRYADSFYACYGSDDDVFVDEIDGIFGAFDALTN